MVSSLLSIIKTFVESATSANSSLGIPFVSNNHNFGWGSLFLFFQRISDSFVLVLFLWQLPTTKKWIMVEGLEIHTFGAKVLNFLELPEITNFLHIYRIHIWYPYCHPLMILNLNLLQDCSNCGACGTSSWLQFKFQSNLFNHFCFKKLSYCHQYIFLATCIQPDVVLKLFLIIWQSEPLSSYQMCSY